MPSWRTLLRATLVLLTILVLAVGMRGTAWSQVVDDTYVLSSGDILSLEDIQMGSLGNVNILADGTVDLPLVGSLHLAGISIDEATALINEEYAKYFKSPNITVQVAYQHPVRVYVQGAVNNPGVQVSGKSTREGNQQLFQLGSASTQQVSYQFYLTDALIQAGGLRVDADLRNIKVIRSYPTPQTIHVNLWELFREGAVVQDLPLREHDIIQVGYLPKDTLQHNSEWRSIAKTNLGTGRFNVNVIGAVQQPGSYRVTGQDSILTAITMAGGFDRLADQKKVFILRTNAAGQVFKKHIDITNPRLTGKKEGDWVALMPEDVIFVDESGGKKTINVGRAVLDRATGAAMLPFFSQLIRNNF